LNQPYFILPFLVLCFISLTAASLVLGLQSISFNEVWLALTSTDDSIASLIVRDLRLPRTLIAIVVGGTLGLAGLLMQTASKNPLSEPGLLGVNAGAAVAVVVFISLVGSSNFAVLNFVAVSGALLTTLVVFGFSSLNGPGFGRTEILLVGSAITGLAASTTQALLILDERSMEDLLFWIAGAFVDRDIAPLIWVSPIVCAIGVIAYWHHTALDLLLTDDHLATAMGLNVWRAKIFVFLGAALLAGICVAMAGPVGFLGLMAPHLARSFGARQHKHLILASILAGTLLALAADIAARFVIMPGEAPITAMMAILGVPWIVIQLKRGRLGGAAA
jgi:iron complex transport system permease protein